MVVFSARGGAPSRQQDSLGVRSQQRFLLLSCKSGLQEVVTILGCYFYLRELVAGTSLPSSGGLEVKPLGIVHFAHVPFGYR